MSAPYTVTSPSGATFTYASEEAWFGAREWFRVSALGTVEEFCAARGVALSSPYAPDIFFTDWAYLAMHAYAESRLEASGAEPAPYVVQGKPVLGMSGARLLAQKIRGIDETRPAPEAPKAGGALPEGWMLVPVEPTPEMLEPFARQACIAAGDDPDEQVTQDWPRWYPMCAGFVDLYKAALSAAPAAPPVFDAAPDMAAALEAAAATFRRYEQMHREKGTAEGRQKADANAQCAKEAEAALARANGEG